MLEHSVLDLDALRKRLVGSSLAQPELRVLCPSKRQNFTPPTAKELKTDASNVIAACSDSWQRYDLDKLCLTAGDAFVCLYKHSSSDEYVCLIRKHQQFLLKLIQWKKLELSIRQLSLVKKVISCHLAGQTVGDLTEDVYEVLKPVQFASADTLVSNLVVAYHFLVLQCLLQLMSVNGTKLFNNEDNFINIQLLDSAAELLLHVSDFIRWLDHAHTFNAASENKHFTNIIKIIQGCLKLCRKLDNKFPSLHTTAAKFSLKLAEFIFKRDHVLDQEPLRSIAFSNDLQVFVNDLEDTTQEPCIIRESASYGTPANTDIFTLLSHINTREDLNVFNIILKSQETKIYGDGAFMAQCCTVGQQLKETPATQKLVHEFLLCVLLHLESKTANLEVLSRQHLSFLDFGVSHFRDIMKTISIQDATSIFRAIEAMKQILSPFKQLKRIRNLSNLLFNLSGKTKSPQMLKRTIEYEFFIHQHGRNSRDEDAQILVNKLDRCLAMLVKSGSTKYCISLLSYFVSQVVAPTIKEAGTEAEYHEVKHQFDYPSISSSVIYCILTEASFVDNIVSLEAPTLKAALFISIVGQLDSFTQEEQLRIIDLLNKSLSLQDPVLQLLCLYHYSLVPNLPPYDEPQVDEIQSQDSFCELLMSGILLYKNINSAWTEATIVRSIQFLEAYFGKTRTHNSYEDQIILSMVDYLAYSGLHGYVNYVVNICSRYRNLSEYSGLKLPIYRLLLAQAESFLKYGSTDNALKRLEASSDLIRQLTKQLKTKDVVLWKLLQLDYYIITGDLGTANEKFNSILKFLKAKPEFNLSSENSNCDLETKIKNLLVVTRFHLVACEFNKHVDNYIDAYRNCKMAIKILSSMLKKLNTDELSVDENSIAWEVNILIIKAHLEMIDTLRQLGIPRDIEYYLKELKKVTDTCLAATIDCLSSIEIFKSYTLLDMRENAQNHIRSVKDICSKISIDQNISFLSILANFTHTAKWDDRLLTPPVLESGDFNSLDKINVQSSLPYKGLVSEGIYMTASFNGTLLEHLEIPHDDIYGAAYEIRRKFQQAIRHTEQFPASSDIRNSVICSPCFTNSPNKIDTMRLPWAELSESIISLLYAETSMSNVVRKDLVQIWSFCESMLAAPGRSLERSKEVFYMEEKVRSQQFTNELAIRDSSSEEAGVLPDQICQFSESYALEEFFEDLESHVPQDWTILTIDICAQTGDLLLSRYSNRRIRNLRLPLARLASRDETVSALTLEEAMQELNSIIKASNDSIKPAVTSNIKDKEDRKKWWKLRFSLDVRLQNLLSKIEHEWLGAFVGIFSACHVTEDFTNSLERIIEMYIPSRRKAKPKLQFDRDMLSIFSMLSLGDNKQKFRQKLRDLLYFLIDSLMYNGEQNDYDELETEPFFEDLQTLFATPTKKDNTHLVLIPSSKCASIPWESFDCLSHRSVSRMPSIQLLMDSLKERHNLLEPCRTAFYMVNPGGDLVRTEAKFKPLFAEQKDWHGIVGQKPTDNAQFLSNVMESDIFIYLGHGGCEQYLRTSSLFKQKQSLPPAFLIGCSSGALQSYGVFGASGNVYTWLTCGSPMVLANLWDVTDKDIDLFSLSVMETCGLLGGNDKNICDSVAVNREKCTLRYLNGCAPVVYGLPLRLI